MKVLFEGERIQDRRDIAVREFKIKYDSLEACLAKSSSTCFYNWMAGERSVPCLYIFFMAATDKPRTPGIIDRVVFAEMPDKDNNPELSEFVIKKKPQHSRTI